MTDTDPWFASDPMRTEPATTTTVDLSDVPLDPRLAALRDGTMPAPSLSPARARRLSVMEAESRSYMTALDEFDRLIAHMAGCTGVRPDILGVALNHLRERRERVQAAYMRNESHLQTLRKSS